MQDGLDRAKVMVAFCFDDYGEHTGLGFETYDELKCLEAQEVAPFEENSVVIWSDISICLLGLLLDYLLRFMKRYDEHKFPWISHI